MKKVSLSNINAVKAGYTPTPKLDKRIKEARSNYGKKKILSWDIVKHVLNK